MNSDTFASTFGFDPEMALLPEPGALLDPRFLAALGERIEETLGEDAAEPALLQIGFLNGLRDAYRVVSDALAGGRPLGLAATPAFAVRFRVGRCAAPVGGLEVTGSWPERREAEAVVARGVDPRRGCVLSAGYTSGWLSGTLEADLLALETRCTAQGAETCRFVAREPAAWEGHERATRLLAALPFDACRAFVRAETESEAPDLPHLVEPALDRESAVVHIWGPVMVIPYAGADEALSAVDLIGRDPGAREVSVVVVDLGGAILDEAFGAVALEQLIETAEAWGAETILAEVSPLSERVVADLSRPPLLVHKDLDEAIAAAFQIARAQRACV